MPCRRLHCDGFGCGCDGAVVTVVGVVDGGGCGCGSGEQLIDLCDLGRAAATFFSYFMACLLPVVRRLFVSMRLYGTAHERTQNACTFAAATEVTHPAWSMVWPVELNLRSSGSKLPDSWGLVWQRSHSPKL